MNRTIALFLVSLCACGPSSGKGAGKKQSPDKVEKPNERNVAVFTLTAKAVERLGIVTAEVERRTIPRSRMMGGEIIPRPGAELTVSAPLGGMLREFSEDPAPAAGATLKRGDPVLDLLPIVAPEARVTLAALRTEASGDVAKARVELDAAKIVLGRAEQLFRDKAGSVREVDEAKARVALAETSMQAAEDRRAAVEKAIANLEAGTVSPIPILSPLDGILTKVHAGPGQQVPAGAPLFRVTDVSRLWVRLPVYVGDVSKIDVDKEASVGDPSARPGTPGEAAKPVPAPPSADPDAVTADLFYSVDNASGRFRPGQRVGVTVVLRVPEESLVVPWAAVLHDVQGGTWVYVRKEGNTFERQRIDVSHVVGKTAVLGRGPAVGTTVVTDGAAELFGTEFGIGK